MNTPNEIHLSNWWKTPWVLTQTTKQVKNLLLEITNYSEKLNQVRKIIISSLAEWKEVNISYFIWFSNQPKVIIKDIVQFDNLRNYAKWWLDITEIVIWNETIDLRTLN